MTRRNETPVRICFVCLGNICRSPTAEGVVQGLLQEAGLAGKVMVESAGTGDWHVGSLPDPRARAAAQRRGLELVSRARQFTPQDWQRFDHVLVMDQANFDDLAKLAPDDAARAKLRLFRSFDPAAAPGAEVPDPYHGGPTGFDHVLDLCEAAGKGLIEALRREHGL
ncbi:MAG TPA: low molecular weight protein-tyrosine-phosphatase [Polyangiaceae bacterium]|nr:low molecular weight protein-tyrosine-phosphatase [Polyangiaceae bacterium]